MSIFNYREEPFYFQRLKKALQATTKELGQRVDQVFGTADSPVTDAQVEELEDILIGADIGVETALEISSEIREKTRGEHITTSFRVKQTLRNALLDLLETMQVDTEEIQESICPHVVFVVGVNGVGKTTVVGKMAHRYGQEGRSVLLCASDTFRAAAVEQLLIWAEMTQTEVVQQGSGVDSGAVLFDAAVAAKARKKEILIVDTSGRIHTKDNLMQELEKMRKIVARQIEGAPHEVYLVLDATTGQNGLLQAREFSRRTGITGIIVTKLDGTAKGGILVAIGKELGIPVRYIGIGEGREDLVPFSAKAFVESLLA